MEYKGQIAGFPTEIVEKMLERQFKKSHKRDITIFEKCKGAARGGFNWAESPKGHSFWSNVITHSNFEVFFEKYPSSDTLIEIL